MSRRKCLARIEKVCDAIISLSVIFIIIMNVLFVLKYFAKDEDNLDQTDKE